MFYSVKNLRKEIDKVRDSYYSKKFGNCAGNLRRECRLFNNIIGAKTSEINKFNISNDELHDPNHYLIANK